MATEERRGKQQDLALVWVFLRKESSREAHQLDRAWCWGLPRDERPTCELHGPSAPRWGSRDRRRGLSCTQSQHGKEFLPWERAQKQLSAPCSVASSLKGAPQEHSPRKPWPTGPPALVQPLRVSGSG